MITGEVYVDFGGPAGGSVTLTGAEPLGQGYYPEKTKTQYFYYSGRLQRLLVRFDACVVMCDVQAGGGAQLCVFVESGIRFQVFIAM